MSPACQRTGFVRVVTLRSEGDMATVPPAVTRTGPAGRTRSGPSPELSRRLSSVSSTPGDVTSVNWSSAPPMLVMSKKAAVSRLLP